VYSDIGDTATRRPPCRCSAGTALARSKTDRWTWRAGVPPPPRVRRSFFFVFRYRRGVRVPFGRRSHCGAVARSRRPSPYPPPHRSLHAVPAHSSDGSRANRIITDTVRVSVLRTTLSDRVRLCAENLFAKRLHPPFPVVTTNVLQFPSVSNSRSLQCLEVRHLSFRVTFARRVASSNDAPPLRWRRFVFTHRPVVRRLLNYVFHRPRPSGG